MGLDVELARIPYAHLNPSLYQKSFQSMNVHRSTWTVTRNRLTSPSVIDDQLRHVDLAFKLSTWLDISPRQHLSCELTPTILEPMSSLELNSDYLRSLVPFALFDTHRRETLIAHTITLFWSISSHLIDNHCIRRRDHSLVLTSSNACNY